ncbi:MAG TPA: hypothetical protein VHB30_09790 [Solirubrobacteraceae bacterium]|nr:hypothetical protein [Solirubrobacteraceae bacterium]
MLCALTVRTLEPGAFESFHEAFMRPLSPDDPPPGWVRFTMLRNVESPDEVICFGLFDGTVDDLRASEADLGYDEQQAAIAPFVASVGASGLYEVVEDLTA